eukprot:GEMP01018734.1.p1 GENE.GEMP01018734.1~~GEMP01018734.1.p1  ORF type:complete len:518 (+),score=156.51 GEMP01018734.1:184-1737(+)
MFWRRKGSSTSIPQEDPEKNKAIKSRRSSPKKKRGGSVAEAPSTPLNNQRTNAVVDVSNRSVASNEGCSSGAWAEAPSGRASSPNDQGTACQTNSECSQTPSTQICTRQDATATHSAHAEQCATRHGAIRVAPGESDEVESSEAEGGAHICRICFDEGPLKGQLPRTANDGERELIAPCLCKGSQRWVHMLCLKNWQISVMMNCGNRPFQSAAEKRHEICNVCQNPFNLAPVRRRDLMAKLANLPASMIGPGLLLVHENERPQRNLTRLPQFLQVLVTIKHSHFKESVYVLTTIEPNAATDGEDKVLGVNLVRSQRFERDMFDTIARAPGTYDQVLAREDMGTQVNFFYGGPCRPRQIRAIALFLAPHICTEVRPMASGEGNDGDTSAQGSSELRTSNGGAASQESERSVPMVEIYRSADGSAQLVWGDVLHILSISQHIASLCIFSGHAEWSRAQLLGEVARGMWGTLRTAEMEPGNVIRLLFPGAEWKHLHPQAEWAPSNSMQEERLLHEQVMFE